MKIEKILNNNVATTRDSHGKEMVVMGRGLVFHCKPGQDIDDSKIEKTFTLSEPGLFARFKELMESIPLDHLLLSERIINYAKTQLGKKISDGIYVTLTDHISGAITRYQDHIILQNPLKWDIERFYRDEYQIGLHANQMIYEATGIRFLDDEAAFIALHFVNAQLGEDIRHVYDITYIMQEICAIVKNYYQMDFDEESLNFYRFITHLKFFAQRMISNIHYDDDESELIGVIKLKYPDAWDCANRVAQMTKTKYHFEMTPDELLYLTIHIARITPRSKTGKAIQGDN